MYTRTVIVSCILYIRLFPDQLRPKMASFRSSSVCSGLPKSGSSQMCKRKLWSRDTSFTRESYPFVLLLGSNGGGCKEGKM